MVDEAPIRDNLRNLIVQTLHLEGLDPASIGDDQPLFGSGLGLDSVDALELMVAVEKEYGIKVDTNEVDRTAFGSVTTLARMIASHMGRAEAVGS
jgi:acyl carrier protein